MSPAVRFCLVGVVSRYPDRGGGGGVVGVVDGGDGGDGWKSSLVGVAETPSRAARRSRIVCDSWLWVAERLAEAARSEVRAASRDAILARRRVVSVDVSDVESREDGEVAIGCGGGRGGWVRESGAGVVGSVVEVVGGSGPALAKVDACCLAETRLPVAPVSDIVRWNRNRMWGE